MPALEIKLNRREITAGELDLRTSLISGLHYF